MPKIGGSVFLIEKGKQTQKVVDAERAFSDEDQAKAQVLFFEKKGSASRKEAGAACLPSVAGKTIQAELKQDAICRRRERQTASLFYSPHDGVTFSRSVHVRSTNNPSVA